MPRRKAALSQPVTRSIAIEGVPFEANDTRHPLAPREYPYRFNADQLRELRAGLTLRTNVVLTGPTGCGKTSVVEQLAARLGVPLVRFNCDGETRVSQLRGQNRPATQDGALTLQFNRGDLAKVMDRGWWVLFDEIDAAPPSVLFVLQPVLEENTRRLHIPETGETISAAPGFAVFATGNTIGYRATSRSKHQGTHSLNAAFLDRFGVVMAVDYPSRLEEIDRIKCHVPDLPEPLIDAIARVAEKCRTDDKFRSDFSTRRAIQWARLAEALGHSRDNFVRAFEATVLRKLESPTDATVAREVLQRVTAA